MATADGTAAAARPSVVGVPRPIDATEVSATNGAVTPTWPLREIESRAAAAPAWPRCEIEALEHRLRELSYCGDFDVVGKDEEEASPLLTVVVVVELLARFLGTLLPLTSTLWKLQREAFLRRPHDFPCAKFSSASSAAPAAAPVSLDRRPPRRRAFCCLLHGNADHFFIYAFTLGVRLKKVSPDVDRVLLCAGKWWRSHTCRAALQRVFTSVRHVALIDAPHATYAPRHTWVFTKIQALRLPYQHLVFLDLDLIPREDLSPLFQIDAPAAMCHGGSGDHLQHGQLIGELAKTEKWWCINAGVVRLDPKPTAKERQREVDALVQEIGKITEPTMLPEQYFLAERLNGWRHISVHWNMEVGMEYDDPGCTWPREHARGEAGHSRGKRWGLVDIADAKVFHFSGSSHHPYWYCDSNPSDTFQELARQYLHRDPRQFVATAVSEWLQAFEEAVECSAAWPHAEREAFMSAVRRQRERASSWRECHRLRRLEEHCECFRCNRRFTSTEGRRLLGWEGWWLCHDCIVGYVLSDEEPPELRCAVCGSQEQGYWSWDKDDCPKWTCITCWIPQ